MRLICLVNNYLGWQALEYLRKQTEVAAVVMHPPERGKFSNEIRASAAAAGAEIFCSDSLRNSDGLNRIAATKPDLGFSIMFGYLLKPDFLSLLPRGCLNLHPAFLPFNRGAHPNVWSIVDGTPAGVTVHFIDEGVDTGDIVCQKKVPILATDTGESLYHKLESAGLELLREAWPVIESGKFKRTPQPAGSGTSHKLSDMAEIDEIDLQKSYKAEDLLNILRAKTFPPHPGAFLRHHGRKVYIRIQLDEESDGNKPEN
ncbi:MAG: formyltransferase family protein [Terriglobales bacterium]